MNVSTLSNFYVGTFFGRQLAFGTWLSHDRQQGTCALGGIRGRALLRSKLRRSIGAKTCLVLTEETLNALVDDHSCCWALTASTASDGRRASECFEAEAASSRSLLLDFLNSKRVFTFLASRRSRFKADCRILDLSFS